MLITNFHPIDSHQISSLQNTTKLANEGPSNLEQILFPHADNSNDRRYDGNKNNDPESMRIILEWQGHICPPQAKDDSRYSQGNC